MSRFPPYRPPPPAPEPGDVVHYVVAGDGQHPPACRVAIVAETDQADPYRVGLSVFWPVGLHPVPLAAGGVEPNWVDQRDPGSWHWPTPDDPAVMPSPGWRPE